MPAAFGDFRFPTIGDAVNGIEATLGNVIEGVIEAATGSNIELTPGNGVDNSRVSGPRGSGDVKFDKKMASHEEVERLRKEVQGRLNDVTRELAKLKMARLPPGFGGFQPRPGFPPFGPQPFPQPGMGYGYGPQQQGMNPMMLLLLLQQQGGGEGFASNPIALLVMMQALQGASIGSVGGQPINIDLTSIAVMASAFGLFRAPAARGAATVVTPGN